MAAVINRGTTEAGIIYTPGRAVADANGILVPQKDILVITERDKGTYLSGQRVILGRGPRSLREHAQIAFAVYRDDAQYIPALAQGVPCVIARKNSGSDYTWMLQGKVDTTFYSEGAGKSPPWDHAAGILAIQEAGGYAALPYGDTKGGERYNPLRCYDRLLVATSPALFHDVHRHVKERAPHLAQPRP
jgi:fructose-1,6-bisphosphatase/inositol monophosphatase family enzyme